MQGDPKVIEVLNEILTAELTAINQYFVHAKMCENWGLTKLAAKAREESIDEMHDADRIIERILFLEGIPNLQRLNSISVGETVPEQLAADLAIEIAAVDRYRRAIEVCVHASDVGTRELLERHLVGEESHADWIEAQQHLISTMGIENYLAQQIG